MFETTVSQKLRSALTQEEVAEWDGDTSCIIEYIKTALNVALDDVNAPMEVKILQHYHGSKIPIVITLDTQEPRLLWYYEGMSASELLDELLGLFADVPLPSQTKL